jgi:hypothetical protein
MERIWSWRKVRVRRVPVRTFMIIPNPKAFVKLRFLFEVKKIKYRRMFRKVFKILNSFGDGEEKPEKERREIKISDKISDTCLTTVKNSSPVILQYKVKYFK